MSYENLALYCSVGAALCVVIPIALTLLASLSRKIANLSSTVNSRTGLGIAAIIGALLTAGAVYYDKMDSDLDKAIQAPNGQITSEVDEPIIETVIPEALSSDNPEMVSVLAGTNSIGRDIDSTGHFHPLVIDDTDISLHFVDRKPLVSARFYDPQGNQFIELIDNEWQLGNQGENSHLRRNYNKNALEVKNERGDVIFQFMMIKNIILIEAKIYSKNGSCYLVSHDSPLRKVTRQEAENIKFYPIFKYPSPTHFGELSEYGKELAETLKNNLRTL